MKSQSETKIVFVLKLPILKTGDYDIWSIRMEQYLTHTDFALWEVIINGDAPAISSASTEVISQEDANLKSLRILPSAWINISLIMRNKADLDELSMDDLYNNLKVYEAEIKSNQLKLKLSDGHAFSSTDADDVIFPTLSKLSKMYFCLSPLSDIHARLLPGVLQTASKSSKDSLEQPKDVRPSARIIEEWETDNDDDCVIRPSFEQNKPSYAKINFVKSDEHTRKSVIEQHTYRQA
ncbi:hypothetical protein Tco_0713498 [Tanacetum coccineum]